LNEEEIRNYLMSMFNILKPKKSNRLTSTLEIFHEDKLIQDNLEQDYRNSKPLTESIFNKRESIKSKNARKSSIQKGSIKKESGRKSSIRKESIKTTILKPVTESSSIKNQLVEQSSNEIISENEENKSIENTPEKEKPKKFCNIS
jgi:hypothetical protein